MRNMDMTFCCEYQNCPFKEDCYRAMDKEQEKASEEFPYTSWVNFEDTEECLKKNMK